MSNRAPEHLSETRRRLAAIVAALGSAFDSCLWAMMGAGKSSIGRRLAARSA